MYKRKRRRRRTVRDLCEMKMAEKRIVCLTAYDFPTAEILSETGVDLILVGDSLGNVILGYESTVPVSMEEMLHHTRAVSRGANGPLVVADMPFLSYGISPEEDIAQAAKFVKEAGADAVKLESGKRILESVRAMDQAGISVMGHLGLTPQTATRLGGYRVQGRSSEAAGKLLLEARAIEEAGAFAIVLECVPGEVAERITEELRIPTIGIGSGMHCDGQILVTQDVLGLTERPPSFVKKYAEQRQSSIEAINRYRQDVREGLYPSVEHTFPMAEEELKGFQKESQ